MFIYDWFLGYVNSVDVFSSGWPTFEKAEESRGEGEEVGGRKWGEVRLKLRAG